MNVNGLHRDRVYELVAARSLGHMPPTWSKKTVEFHTKRGHFSKDGALTSKALDVLATAETPYSILGRVVERKYDRYVRKGICEPYDVTHWVPTNPISRETWRRHGMTFVAMSSDGRTCYVQHSWCMGIDSIIAVETIDFVSLFAAAFGIIARPSMAVAA